VRLRRALHAGQAALRVRLSRLPEADEHDVHQCRVECRRLRSLLKSFSLYFSAEQARGFRAALKQVAGLLAEIRELDVLAAQPGLQIDLYVRELTAARQQAVKRLARRLASPSNRAAVERCARGPSRGNLGLRAGITDTEVLRRVRRTWRRTQRALEPRPRTQRQLHELRIRLKNCRYCLEIVQDISPEEVASLRLRLRDAQPKPRRTGCCQTRDVRCVVVLQASRCSDGSSGWTGTSSPGSTGWHVPASAGTAPSRG
jgi:CHAD domain-containing protein